MSLKDQSPVSKKNCLDLSKDTTPFETPNDKESSNNQNVINNEPNLIDTELPGDENTKLKLNHSNQTLSSSDKIDNIIFQLNWSIRDELIININQHNQLLIGKMISKDNREMILKNNIGLYRVLVNLKLKTNEEIKNDTSDKVGSNEIVLDLDWNTRLKVIILIIDLNELLKLLNY